ncbi:MAG: radical SAM family heme chaperone HemW [Firmicutes bacterium]|nr:radical SAM family heme chaperone HemW [Bacillota bacterium]NBI64677.1 radical SAM family heme chaperone HemW [Clostridiales bacterium]
MTINKEQGQAGLYVHIPFCLKKCGYCGFLSFGGCSEETQRQYVQALVRELEFHKGENAAIDTIYIGGGTPSLLPADCVEAILDAARENFKVTEDPEISLEVNPKTLTESKLKIYHRAGVNRLSLGAQSMDDGLLVFMGRAHDQADFQESWRMVREQGFSNVNVDLMFGVPGQSQDLWEDSLKQVLELRPEHVSFYSLQLEEGTPFYRQYKAGEMDLPSTEEDRRMYHQGIHMLKKAGYDHYEISNCARPGFASRHNSKYWNFEEYFAVGLGAHSFRYDQGRQRNVSHLETYIQRIRQGLLPVDERAFQQESLRDHMGEYVFTALRKSEGLDTADFEKVFGTSFFSVYKEQMTAVSTYQEQGLLYVNGGRIALTEKGIDCSNEIMAEFV